MLVAAAQRCISWWSKTLITHPEWDLREDWGSGGGGGELILVLRCLRCNYQGQEMKQEPGFVAMKTKNS